MASSAQARPQDPKPSMSAAETSEARSKNLKLVFVTGGPGSGKGTQCTQIVESFGFEHVSAGDLLRLEQNSGTETGNMIKGMIKEGKLVPSETTVKLILKAISESSNNKFLIDGFPRNDENREVWDRVAGLSPEFILFITGSEEEMERRVLSRNEGRDDDNIETIRKRFKVFNESTLPVIKHYETIATVHKINGLMTVDEVFAQIRPLFEPIVQEELLEANVDLLEGLDTGNYKTHQRCCHPAVTDFEPQSQDLGAWEMVMGPISQVRQALQTIERVSMMACAVCVNKIQCKRIADRFSAIGDGLKGLRLDENFNIGNASDGRVFKDYPAFDELLTVLRKGEALVSSYVDSNGIVSVVTSADNRESFQEIHDELEALKAQFDFESFSELGQVKDFEASAGVERTNALAADADQDLTEMPKDMAQIKDSKNTTGMDMEKATQVVLEKSGILGPSDELPSYLKIDQTAITIGDPVRPVVVKSERVNADELGWAVVRFGKWIGCDFAVKVFKSTATELAGWNNKQLLMEVGSLANLRHPHIVRLVGFGQDAEKCIFLMEWMDDDLRNFMTDKLKLFPSPKPRPFKRAEELDIITQIAKGMHYMHTQQYAHGDLKCSNILVKKFNDYLEVKIADLRGSQKLGKVWDAEAFKQASLTRRPRWTAPEAIDHYGWQEPSSALLKKGDVYSFGMTCYEVVTGMYPFDGIKGDVLREQIHAGVRPELPGDLDEDLKGLIKKCWDRDPNKRPDFGEIIFLLSYIRSKKPTVQWNKFSSRDMVLSLIKKIPQVQGVFTGLLGKVRQRRALTNDSTDDSSVWGEEGDGGFQRSDSALSVPEHLRIQPDKLEKVRRIGKGATATVYEATWLGCTFAVKVFRIPSSPLNIRDLQREVDFLIKLSRHPCIAQMVGLSVDSHQRCSIVMELMDGNLHDLIESRMRKRTPVTAEAENELLECVVVPFELHEALPIISKIALGMAFLHSKGVMHRDLKSGNVLAKEHAESIDVKLVDFGMSLHELESDGHGSYLGIGTGFWRAPELFPGGDSLRMPDLKAADVYSFAMTCYEVLTGKTPFSHLLRTDYSPVINGERPRLPTLLHPGLKALVQQCWHADPVQRPNFTEICENLQKFRQSLPS